MKTKTKVILAAAAAAVIAVVLVVFAASAGAFTNTAKQLAMGRSFLEELNYEKAELAFSKVLKIEPHNVIANSGMIAVRMGQNRTEEIALYQQAAAQGYTEIGETLNKEIEEPGSTKQEEIQNALDQFQQTQDPEGLESFEDREEELRKEYEEDLKRLEEELSDPEFIEYQKNNPESDQRSIKEFQEDYLKEIYVLNKPYWHLTDEEITEGLEKGWIYESQLEDIAAARQEYYAEVALLSQRMVNFILNGDPQQVAMVLSGRGIVLLAEEPVVAYKTDLDLLEGEFDSQGIDLWNIQSEKALDQFITDHVGNFWLNEDKQIKSYAEEEHKLRHVYQLIRERTTPIERAFVAYEYNITTGRFMWMSPDVFLKEYGQYANYMNFIAWLIEIGSGSDDHLEKMRDFLTHEYVLASGVKHLIMQKAVFEHFYQDERYDRILAIVQETAAKADPTAIVYDRLVQNAEGMENLLKKREEIWQIYQNPGEYQAQLLAEKAAEEAENS